MTKEKCRRRERERQTNKGRYIDDQTDVGSNSSIVVLGNNAEGCHSRSINNMSNGNKNNNNTEERNNKCSNSKSGNNGPFPFPLKQTSLT